MIVLRTRRLVVVAVAALLAAGGYLAACQHIFNNEDHDEAHGAKADGHVHEGLWTCPMHPEVVQEEPGTCPICKMDLVPMKGPRAGVSDEDSTEVSGKGGPSAVVIDPVVVQNMGVRVAEVEQGQIFRNVQTVGEVTVADDQISVVNLRFSGWIERIFVDETGQEVKKGQALFAVYSPELVAAQEEYLLAVGTGGVDGMLARSAARRLELWGISRGLLKRIVKTGKSRRNITINAPRSGYVLHKNVVEGARVQAGADLYRIGDLDRIWVTAEIYEHDAAWVQQGQRATMELSYQQGMTWEGTVSYVYPTLNPRTRSLTVRLEFDNPGLGLRPGMLATVRIETRRKDHATTVPSEAVIHSGERRLVFVATGGGHYEAREVVIGLMGDNRRAEVMEGLAEGERVVVSGQFLLDSESQLQEAVQKLLESRLEARRGAEASAKE